MRPGLRIRIGDLEHAGVGRKAYRDRHLVLEMQRLAHARRLRARNELAEQDDALGVGGPLRRLLAERRVERIDERFGGRGHRGLLPCVHRRPPGLVRIYHATAAPVRADLRPTRSSKRSPGRARFIALVECAMWAALVYAILGKLPTMQQGWSPFGYLVPAAILFGIGTYSM